MPSPWTAYRPYWATPNARALVAGCRACTKPRPPPAGRRRPAPTAEERPRAARPGPRRRCKSLPAAEQQQGQQHAATEDNPNTSSRYGPQGRPGRSFASQSPPGSHTEQDNKSRHAERRGVNAWGLVRVENGDDGRPGGGLSGPRGLLGPPEPAHPGARPDRARPEVQSAAQT